jgi:hypothetical protein
MSVDVKFARVAAKLGSVAIMVLLVLGALGPANWTPRTALGWQMDTSSGILRLPFLFALLGPGRSLSGECLWPPLHCWKLCRL